ncbi:hypothetical protein BDZ97DRAFT_1294846 [Flammula alnicola]|nr:hypothetical protein BDZ97DRAFT_1294846 [Flammula alnicola]
MRPLSSRPPPILAFTIITHDIFPNSATIHALLDFLSFFIAWDIGSIASFHIFPLFIIINIYIVSLFHVSLTMAIHVINSTHQQFNAGLLYPSMLAYTDNNRFSSGLRQDLYRPKNM